MNNSKDNKYLIYSHRTLNYYSALFQGIFAQQNIFSQLQDSNFNEERIKNVKIALQNIRKHTEDLYKGKLLFSSDESAEKIEQQKTLLSDLAAEKEKLKDQANKIKAIILNENYYQEKENVIFLISSFGQCAYSKDNYVRGILKFNNFFKINTLDNISEYIDENLKQNLELTSEFIKLFKDKDKINPNFYDHLRFSCRTLPGILRTQAHDILQITGKVKEDISFEEADFHSLEAKAWEEAGYNATQAGYWRAFELGVKEASLWKTFNVEDPLIVSEWHSAGFHPEDAKPWMDVLFSPLLAIQWQHAGFTPRDSSLLLRMGYSLPSEVPEDQVDELLKQSVNEIAESENLDLNDE